MDGYRQDLKTVAGRRRQKQSQGALDYYPTPEPVIEDILDHIGGTLIIDPCAGDGRIAQIAERRGQSGLAYDIEPRDPSVIRHDFWQGPERIVQEIQARKPIDPVWVLNPPYFDGFAWLVAVRDICRTYGHRSAVLLPLAMLAGVKRHRYWAKADPPGLRILSRRPRFIGQATAQYDVAWFLYPDSEMTFALIDRPRASSA